MTELVFYDRKSNNKFTIDTIKYNYVMEIYHIIKEKVNILPTTDVKIFCSQFNNGKMEQIFYNGTSKLEDMLYLINSKTIRHFDLYYKSTEHGLQTADMTPSNHGQVISGYKRFVNKDGDETIIGDINGAHITIPKGALASSSNISIQTINVTDDFFQSKIGNKLTNAVNVTKGVGYNTKANDFVNKNFK